jgi:MFS family permease
MTGVYMLAIAVPLATVSFASGYLIDKTGRFLEVLQAGLLFMTIGVGLLISLNTTQENGRLIPIMFVIGLGFGPNFGAPLIALQTRIQESDIATGTAAFGFVRMVFGALGVVLGQVIFQLLMAPHYDAFVEAGIPQDVAYRLARGEAISTARAASTMPPDQSLAIKTSLSSALRGTWIFYTVISALGLLVSFGIERKKLYRGADSEIPTRTLKTRSAGDNTLFSSERDQRV